jgi:hypothetical protein
MTVLLKVVVASPGDVEDERKAVSNIITRINRTVAENLDLTLRVIKWETDVYPGFHEAGAQGQIDKLVKIEDCDVFVGIFWKRFGKPTQYGETGTEHEINTAIKAWKKNHKPNVMIYFNKKEYSLFTEEETEQLKLIIKFKKKLADEGGLYKEYYGVDEFNTLFHDDLVLYLNNNFQKSLAASTIDSKEKSQNIFEQMEMKYNQFVNEYNLNNCGFTLITPNTDFSGGNSDCWQIGSFRDQDIKSGYDAKRDINEKIIEHLKNHNKKGTII